MWRRCVISLSFTNIYMLPTLEPGTTVTIRCRLDNARVKGKLGFLQLRQPPLSTVQAVVADNPDLITTAKQLTKESVIEITGKTQTPAKPVASASCSNVEISVDAIKVISAAQVPLPFPLRDTTPKLDTRLDNRAYDLRTLPNAGVFRIQSATTQLYRRFMTQRAFLEIHSPKMIGTPSEGGSAVFELGYFNQKGYLAQSPQLYKQMAVQGDLTKVIEIGPVFRAENSQTHRHLTEYTGLDMEMAINYSYHEVLDVLEEVVVYIITTLQAEAQEWIHAALSDLRSEETGEPLPMPAPIVPTLSSEVIVAHQIGDDSNNIASGDKYGGRIGHEDCPVLRMTFDNAVQLLIDHGILPATKEGETPINDFNSSTEKELGKIIKERYGVDVFLLDQFHLSARAFYTKPGSDGVHSESFDLFVRGEEICSGAQRIHDVDQLLVRAQACGVSTDLIADYVNAFRYGAWPHGGFGIGLERFVMLFLGLPNVRMASMFPRDPKRIRP